MEGSIEQNILQVPFILKIGDEILCNLCMMSTWRRAWQPTPVFLPGESQAQRSLAGYSSWACKELDVTE